MVGEQDQLQLVELGRHGWSPSRWSRPRCSDHPEPRPRAVSGRQPDSSPLPFSGDSNASNDSEIEWKVGGIRSGWPDCCGGAAQTAHKRLERPPSVPVCRWRFGAGGRCGLRRGIGPAVGPRPSRRFEFHQALGFEQQALDQLASDVRVGFIEHIATVPWRGVKSIWSFRRSLSHRAAGSRVGLVRGNNNLFKIETIILRNSLKIASV